MQLFFAPFSPYARKCRVMVIEKGLEKRVELVNVAPMENPPELLEVNPLASVPALLLDNGNALCESPVICEYLDTLSDKPSLFPAFNSPKRFEVLGTAALADGMMDAAVSCVLESRKPDDKRSPEWIARKENAIRRSIKTIARLPLDAKAPLDIATIGIVIALDYIGFRLPHLAWRSEHAVLAAWLDEISKRPSLADTAPR